MWHRSDEFTDSLSRIAVVSRPECEAEMTDNLKRVRENLPGLAEIVDLLPIVDIPISSTEVRESLRSGVIPENCLHPDVEQYIDEKCLYGLRGDPV